MTVIKQRQPAAKPRKAKSFGCSKCDSSPLAKPCHEGSEFCKRCGMESCTECVAYGIAADTRDEPKPEAKTGPGELGDESGWLAPLKIESGSKYDERESAVDPRDERKASVQN